LIDFKFYQIRAKSARIIRESTLKPEIRQMPQVPSEYKMLKSQSQNSDLQPMSSSAAMKAFNDFSLSNDEDDHKRKEDLPLTSSRKYEKSKVKASDRKEKGKEREMQID
jgi:hypothetical protein